LSPGASPPPVEIAIRIKSEGSGCPELGPCLDGVDYLAGCGVAVECLLGKHQMPVDDNLEDTTPRWDGFHLHLGPFLSELGHQTGDPGLIVSNDAVFNRDDHWVPRF